MNRFHTPGEGAGKLRPAHLHPGGQHSGQALPFGRGARQRPRPAGAGGHPPERRPRAAGDSGPSWQRPLTPTLQECLVAGAVPAGSFDGPILGAPIRQRFKIPIAGQDRELMLSRQGGPHHVDLRYDAAYAAQLEGNHPVAPSRLAIQGPQASVAQQRGEPATILVRLWAR
jgi:hypothetical protein